jgi:prephenate dehydrogenase
LSSLEKFEKVLIVGLGLIGGSLTKAIKKHYPHIIVIGDDPDRRSIELALKDEVIDEPISDISHLGYFDLVFICSPVMNVIASAKKYIKYLHLGGIMTDVGSAKEAIVRDLDNLNDRGYNFIGGHPMAGSEKWGYENSTSDLFHGSYYVLTPTSRTETSSYLRLYEFISGLGARVVTLDAREHDFAVAITSHLPQLISTSLVRLAMEQSKSEGSLKLLTAGSFKDVTRIASGNPEIWKQILIENSSLIKRALELFINRLNEFGEKVSNKNESEVFDYLAISRNFREEIIVYSNQKDEIRTIKVKVMNRPGELGRILGKIGSKGINIEDIEIIHHPEEGYGVMSIMLNGNINFEKVYVLMKNLGVLIEDGQEVS